MRFPGMASEKNEKLRKKQEILRNGGFFFRFFPLSGLLFHGLTVSYLHVFLIENWR